ncbi:AfsR/SARP family transcriptional regulator [Asanoa hainanensis]|uniref:AfsR/SARP family transcriptional regulator n=1 Tax=Asanoa hainanensis TaxID=560556 RepID=UPI000B795656|nr:BTAD domain-containing putative transcriptional regulator [Asanoa hainanensis]
MPAVEVRILGAVEIVADGVVAALTSAPARTVLAALALRSGVLVQVDDLVDMVWGAAPPRTAVNQLQIAVHRIRRAFAPAGLNPQVLLATHPAGYRLAADAVEVDLGAFRSLTAGAAQRAASADWSGASKGYEAALRLWRGRACQDASGERIRSAGGLLDAERMEALQRHLAVDLLAGRPVTEQTADLVLAEPLRERFWVLHVLGLALEGRQAEALAAYRRAQQVLADELGLDPGAELRSLERHVLLGDTGAGVALVRAWFGGSPARPAPRVLQLPADVAYFTGRVAELERVGALLSGAFARPVTVCASGLGGAGKTTLAVHLAHRLDTEAVFVDLHGTEPSPPEAYQVMGSILRSLGLPGPSVPSDRDARAGLYRSTMAERRPLLVLDNAAGEAQVRPLLPGAPGCRTIVTSRSTLSGLDGAVAVEPGVLGARDAAALLDNVSGRSRTVDEPDAARRLLSLCGGLPLALRIVGVRLARQPGTSLERMAARLDDERSRLDELAVGDRDVRAVFAESLRLVDESAALLLRRLALLPVPSAGASLAAALLDVGLPDASRRLERLSAASLVSVWDTGQELRYRMHDLVRLFARELCEDADVAALRRGYEALLSQALRADLGSRPYPAEPAPAGPATSPVDQALVLSAALDCVARGWVTLAWRLVCATTNVALTHAYGPEWTDAAGRVLAAGPGPEGAAALQLGLGMVWQRSGRPLAARGPLRAARRAYAVGGDSLRAATAATYLSMAYRVLGRWRPALAAVGWAVARLDTSPVPVQLGWAQLALGNLLLEMDDPPAARSEYARALTVMRTAGDRAGEANVLIALAQSLRRSGRYEQMTMRYHEAVQILREVDEPLGLLMVEIALGRVSLRAGDLGAARQHSEQALALVARAPFALARKDALDLAGEVALAGGNLSAALELFAGTLEIARTQSAPVGVASVLHHLARAQRAAGDIEAARDVSDRVTGDLHCTGAQRAAGPCRPPP